jgi:BirA family biotin operon repressor/biotin-[acetyl-CoA-carboxylase] ligase
MSGNKKICGILNEIKVKGNFIEEIVVGFGLNVNQENFDNLPNASSLKKITSINYDLDGIINLFIQNIKKYNYLKKLVSSEPDYSKLLATYNNNLFGLKLILEFFNKTSKFKGQILSVSSTGTINIKKNSGSIGNYNIHEIKLIY